MRFYGATLLAISLAINAMCLYVVRNRATLAPDMSDEDAAYVARVGAPNTVLYLVGGGIALLAPQVAAFGFLAIAIQSIIRDPAIQRD